MMEKNSGRSLYIIGCGGEAKEVYCYIKDAGHNVTGFIDRGAENDTMFLGLPVFTDEYVLNLEEDIDVVVAIGSPKLKKKIVGNYIAKDNISFPVIIAKGAVVLDGVEIGRGSIIAPNAVLTTDIKIGEFVLVNYLSSIGHDSTIGNFSTINPGSNIAGNVLIGTQCDIGSGTKVIQNKSIADNTTTGAGAVVVNDVNEENCLLVGVPAKVIRRNYGI